MNGGSTGSRVAGIFEYALKTVVALAFILLVLRLWPTEGGGNALGEALGGIGGAIGQLDDLIRDIRGASAS
jgi:hypothetical protein